MHARYLSYSLALAYLSVSIDISVWALFSWNMAQAKSLAAKIKWMYKGSTFLQFWWPQALLQSRCSWVPHERALIHYCEGENRIRASFSYEQSHLLLSPFKSSLGCSCPSLRHKHVGLEPRDNQTDTDTKESGVILVWYYVYVFSCMCSCMFSCVYTQVLCTGKGSGDDDAEPDQFTF